MSGQSTDEVGIRVTARSTLGAKSILVTGDNWNVRHKLFAALMEQGYAAVEAANDQHALAVLEESCERIDLLLDAPDWRKPKGPSSAWASYATRLPIMVLFPEEQETVERCYSPSGQPYQALLRTLDNIFDGEVLKGGVLVVDQDDAVRRQVSEALHGVGYDVMEAVSGREALRRIALRTPDAVLTEVVLPELDGLELLQEVKRNFPSVKVVAMSESWRADTYLAVTRALGASATLHKPLSLGPLLDTFGRLIRGPGGDNHSAYSD
jgi:CheY-like chemotaxis protein